MNCGAILLDGDKRILHLNGLARKRLGEAVSSHNGCLCAADRACDATFQTILDQSLERRRPGRERSREAIGLKRPERRPVVARVIPVAGEVRAMLDGAELIVILLDPEDCPELPHDLLKQIFGLTQGEARLAGRLLGGQSLREIADACGVSVGTIRSQTKAVFIKTRTHRQSELVRLLTRLAMISEGSAGP
jgi:DNA-binding CsgD family transcriptional regulator